MNIIGRITRDAQIKTVSENKQVVNFSVAVNDSYRNKQGELVKLTEYFNCSYWISVNVAKVLTKGTLVEVTGRVSPRAWVDDNGEVHAALNFHTSDIKLYGGGRKTETAGSEHTNIYEVGEKQINGTSKTDDLPF